MNGFLEYSKSKTEDVMAQLDSVYNFLTGEKQVIDRKFNILLIEDRKEHQKDFMDLILKINTFRYDIQVADNAYKGLRILERKEGTLPDIIVLDFYMPDMDKLEFLECIKRSGYDFCVKSIPVILCSEDKEICKELEGKLNVKYTLSKPFDEKELEKGLKACKNLWHILKVA